MIKSHLEGQGLFSNKYIVFLDRVTEKAEARDGLLDLLPEMKTSANIFIVLEGAVKAELKKAFDKKKISMFLRLLTLSALEMHTSHGHFIGKR